MIFLLPAQLKVRSHAVYETACFQYRIHCVYLSSAVYLYSCIMHRLTSCKVFLALKRVPTCEPNCLCMVRKWFVYQMNVHVDETANIRCAICIQFAYHSLQTKICRFFEQAQRKLCTPRFFHVCELHACCLRFLNFVQYGLVSVRQVRAETMVRYVFTSHSQKINLPCALCELYRNCAAGWRRSCVDQALLCMSPESELNKDLIFVLMITIQQLVFILQALLSYFLMILVF